MKAIKILAGVLAVLSMASCSSSDDDTSYILTTIYDDDDCFVVADYNGTTSMIQEADFTLKYDYAKGTLDLTVDDLGYDSMSEYPEFTITGLRWAYNQQHWKYTKAMNVTPVSSGAVPKVSEVEVAMLDRVISGAASPVISIRLSMADGARYTVYPVQMAYFGTTVVSASGAPDFVNPESNYILKFNVPARKADLRINSARFAASMPANLNMDFKNIDFTASLNSISLNSASLVPQIGGDPYPSFAISQLSGTFTLATNSALRFNCLAMGTDYTVNAALAVLPADVK